MVKEEERETIVGDSQFRIKSNIFVTYICIIAYNLYQTVLCNRTTLREQCQYTHTLHAYTCRKLTDLPTRAMVCRVALILPPTPPYRIILDGYGLGPMFSEFSKTQFVRRTYIVFVRT